MSSFNKVIIMGNLTRDPETRAANSGTAVVNFSMALSRRYKVGDDWQEKTDFVDVTMFGKRGEAFAKFHKKGAKALIEGSLRQDVWMDKQTEQRRSKVYVVGDTWEFVLEHSAKEKEKPAETVAQDQIDDSLDWDDDDASVPNPF